MSVRDLCPILKKKAKVELGEDPEKIRTSLENIKDWIKKQPHLHNNIRDDDQWLLMFLRGCKYSLETAKKKIDNFNAYRVIYHDLVNVGDPFKPEIQSILNSGYFCPTVTIKSNDGYPEVTIYRLSMLRGLDSNLEYIFTASTMIILILAFENDNLSISGQASIIDADLEAKDMMIFMNPISLRKIISITQDGWPIRQKGIHIVNMSPRWEAMITFVKRLMNEKIRKRLSFHSNYDTLKEHFQPEQLPKEYGGTAGSFEELKDYWKQKVESYESWYKNDIKYKSDESKRIVSSNESAHEMIGSFRKIEFD